MIRRSEIDVEKAGSDKPRRVSKPSELGANRLGVDSPRDSDAGPSSVAYESPQSLEDRAAEYRGHLRQAGIAYAESSRILNAEKVYNQSVQEVTQGEPQRLRDYRAALNSTLETLDLPSLSQYKPGSKEAEQAAKEAIAKVISVLGTTTDQPTDLQRLLVSQGAKYFPVMDEVELWVRRRDGEGAQRQEYWAHVFTHSPDREEEVEKLGIKDGQPIIHNGVATRGHGRKKVYESHGPVFHSTSQDSLSAQDPQGYFFGPDEILIQAALHEMRAGSDDELFERHKDRIKSVVPEFRGKSDEWVRARRAELREKEPTLSHFLNKFGIPLYHNGVLEGLLKGTYRLRNSGEMAGTDSGDGLMTMVLDDSQRSLENPQIKEWLVEEYALGMKLPETEKIVKARDEDGAPRFPIPTVEELERDPDAWSRLHALNSHQRYFASQRLRNWVVGQKEDAGLENLLGRNKRQEILARIREEHASDPTNQHVPERLASLDTVANAGLNVVYGRMLMPVMRDHFKGVLKDVEAVYGPQREATPHDMDAVTEALEVTRPDPITKMKVLEAVQAMAPYLVEAIGLAPEGVEIDRSQGGLETALKQKPDDSLLGQTRAGYEYGEVLGMGAMGIVFEARHKKLGRKVALKLLSGENIHAGVDPEVVQVHKSKFEREGQMLGRFEHPNIMRIYDAGQEGDLHYQAVEILRGGSVQERIDDKGVMEEGDARALLGQVGSALQATEEEGVIHRDIKPENVMITPAGNYKLVDFGLAIEEGEEVEASGTPLFIAPEQWKGLPTTQSDLYALGTTAYVALTGETPYGTENLGELLRAKVRGEGEFTPLREHNPEVSEDLEAIIHKLMALDTSERYQNAAELLADLGGQGGPSGQILQHPRGKPREDAA